MKRMLLLLTVLLFTGIHSQAQSGIQKLSDKAALEAAIANNENVVIIFAAEWCEYCKDFLPKAEKITADYEKVKFFKINYDENLDFFMAEGIEVVPTTRLYKNGKEADELVVLETAPLREKLRDF